MMKLIKLNGHFYVYKAETKSITKEKPKNEYYLASNNEVHRLNETALLYFKGKITHSTQNLDGVVKLNVSDVEDVVYGNIDELVKAAYQKHSVRDDKLSLDEQIQRSGGFSVGYKEGFRAHQELTKTTWDILIDENNKITLL